MSMQLLKSFQTQLAHLADLRMEILNAESDLVDDNERRIMLAEVDQMIQTAHDEIRSLGDVSREKDLNANIERLRKLRDDLLAFRPGGEADERKRKSRLRKVDGWMQACEEEILNCRVLMQGGLDEAKDVLSRF